MTNASNMKELSASQNVSSNEGPSARHHLDLNPALLVEFEYVRYTFKNIFTSSWTFKELSKDMLHAYIHVYKDMASEH